MTKNQRKDLELVSIISKNPGIQFREIMRATGMQNGVLSYHIGKLEKLGLVQAQRKPRQTRFFPLNISQEESKIISALRRETPRDIIEFLILNENLEFNELVKHVKKAPSTVSLYLSQLVEERIVQIQFFNKKRIYKVHNKKLVDKLIEEYRPSMLERATSGFEDIINAL